MYAVRSSLEAEVFKVRIANVFIGFESLRKVYRSALLKLNYINKSKEEISVVIKH